MIFSFSQDLLLEYVWGADYLGECWPPLISAIRECLIVGEEDLQLLHFARHPEDAVEVVKQGLQAPGQRGPGLRG